MAGHGWPGEPKLRRAAFALWATARQASLHHGWPAEPKLQRSEGWRPGLDLNQDKERCLAPASTLFRHRAAPTIADHAGASYRRRRLTLTDPVKTWPLSRLGLIEPSEGVAGHEGHAPRIVADIDVRARGGEPAFGEFCGDFGPAVALQADFRAQ